jgi:hypothetical protein
VAHFGAHNSLAGTQSNPLKLTKPAHRCERLRRAASSSAASPEKNTTAAKAALPTLAHAGERTLSGTVPGGISCDVGFRPWDARRVMSLVASGTGAHTFTLSHAALDGHRMAQSTGCRDVRLVPALVYCNATFSRCARTHTHPCHDLLHGAGELQLLCAAPPSRTVDRFCSSKVRCARPPVCPCKGCKLARDSHSVYYVAASTP